MEIQAGEGGTDSKLFVHDLAAAYVKYAASKRLNAEILATGDGHQMLQIVGKGVWAVFGQESGKHCLQRVPPTEKRGRRQTSMVSIMGLISSISESLS